MKGMIYDCFQFFNELDILKLRLNIMKDIADYFVISESVVTFSGDSKPLFYEENKDLFREFRDRIIHVVVEDTPMDTDAFGRDHHQKCAVARGLVNCSPDDIVIFSDADEIPDPETLRKLLPSIEDGRIYMPAQRLFYCYLNLEDVSGKNLSVTGEFEDVPESERKWLGTKICRYGMLKDRTTESLRDAESRSIGVRVENGGWHFSYMGGTGKESVEERLRYKIKSAAHQEYNTRRSLFEASRRIRQKSDMFGREAELKVVPVDDSYPAYLRDHLDEYRYLLYREPGFFEKIRYSGTEFLLSLRDRMRDKGK